jgi:hypothetical protein
MLSFLAKKDKNKPSTYKPKVPPKYRTFFAKSYHANDRDNNMSLKIKKTVDLNLVVHQFVKTTKAHYRTMLKVSQNGNTIQHLSFLPSKKSKNISWSK